MPSFLAHDGTELAFHVKGTGVPLVCVPGGPGRASRYLGDLGGLPRRLILLDGRGSGDSAVPADAETYRWDRQAADVEALREHLGLERMDLLAHSAGANVAVRYSGLHPGRLESLCLVAPSPVAVGFVPTEDDWRAGLELREDEPWYESALAEFRSGDGLEGHRFLYGPWTERARAHAAGAEDECAEAAGDGFYAPSPVTPDEVRAGLAALDAPVLLLTGDLDAHPCRLYARPFASLFRDATPVTMPGAGHFPWVDDPDAFVRIVADFLDRRG
ncbi:alpha/beta hydrolase [Nonomuraea sp. WAC 01424]|uniref:alpha/beta fold hydrolase n=1 Tax=Nonomuraea sp. WAC 01424 TaxID=2203200 RepID=UPI000F79EAE0|nr:alpha/beta hydrolase [Nonomuraea sp. WAC 01424]RSM96508.1 alpha/beta hydrolase [Nonomuraea sp. WAC 01424]